MLGNKSKRVMALAVSAAMLLPMMSLAACKKKAKVEVPTVKETDPFFEVTDIELKLPVDEGREIESLDVDRDDFRFSGNTITFSFYVNYVMPQEVKESLDDLAAYNWDKYQEVLREYSDYKSVVFDMEGNLLREGKNRGGDDGGEYEELIMCSFENNQGETMAIVRRATGVFLEQIKDNGEMVQIKELEYVFGTSAFMIPDGRVICTGYDGLSVLGADYSLQNSAFLEGFYGQAFYQNGKCYGLFTYYDYDDFENDYNYFQEIDLNTLSPVGEKIKSVYRGWLLQSKTGVYEFNRNGIRKAGILDVENDTEVFAWSNTDFNPKNVLRQQLKIKSDNEFFFLSLNDEVNGEYIIFHPSIVHAVRSEKNPYAGKKQLSIGSYNEGINMDDIIRYNQREDSTCRVSMINYSDDMRMAGDWMNREAALSDKVYLDVISGNGPDILVDFSQFSQFNSENILVDLNTFIDSEDGKGLDRSKYFDNILRAMEVDGKMYHIPLSFCLLGLIGNGSLVGQAKPWTYAEFMEEMDKLPEGINAMDVIPYKHLLDLLMSNTGEGFVDYASKEVHFEEEAFKEMLAFAKKYGTSKTYEQMRSDDGYVYEYERFSNGMLAWMNMQMWHVKDYARYIDMYGTNVVFCGIPSSTGGSIAAVASPTLGISKFSPCQEEAWDSIRYLLECQEDIEWGNGGGLSISRSAVNKANQVAISAYEEEVRTFKVDPHNPQRHPIEITEEMASEFVKIVENVRVVSSSDPQVNMIILEEAPAYFLDQKSLDDVCRNIQNRTKNLVQER